MTTALAVEPYKVLRPNQTIRGVHPSPGDVIDLAGVAPWTITAMEQQGIIIRTNDPVTVAPLADATPPARHVSEADPVEGSGDGGSAPEATATTLDASPTLDGSLPSGDGGSGIGGGTDDLGGFVDIGPAATNPKRPKTAKRSGTKSKSKSKSKARSK